MPDQLDFLFGGVVKVGDLIHSIGGFDVGLEAAWRKDSYDFRIPICNRNRIDPDARELLLFGFHEHS